MPDIGLVKLEEILKLKLVKRNFRIKNLKFHKHLALKTSIRYLF